jgi:Kdo2-lipid IVA lauroyltransferase/acyltransferase
MAAGRRHRVRTRQQARRWKARRNRGFTFLLAGLRGLLRFLPWRLVLAAGWCLGALGYLAQPRRRRRAQENLGRALGLPEPESRRLSHRVFTSIGMNLAETFWVSARPSRCERLFSFEGVAQARAILARGKGAVLITGHLGSWELMGAATGRWGYPLTVMARGAVDGRVGEFLEDLRDRLGIRTVIRGEPGAARKMLATLRSGELLGFLIDQDIESDGVLVEFFGRPAQTPTGPVSLAERLDVPVMPCATWRLPDGTHRVRIDPPLEIPPPPPGVSTVAAHTAALTRWLEERIREHPEQWVWIHRRWRRAERRAPEETP